MSRKRIGHHVGGGPEPEAERAEREREDALKEAYARWASGVTILATRAEGRVHALTVSAFIPVSLDPPLVLASLGPNASALPYLEPGATFAVSILRADQKGLSSRFADSFPVGPSPFAQAGPPTVDGALAAFVCRVEELLPRGDHTLVTGAVNHVIEGPEEPALVYYRRDYDSAG